MFRYFLILSLLMPLAGYSQSPVNSSITGTISGFLTDSINGLPFEYASVGIIDVATGKVVNGTITDEKGFFRVGSLPLGTYKMNISFVGYASKTVPGIQLTPQRPDYDAGKVNLISESHLLDEIRISGEAALIESRPDKIVYNAERDVTSVGGDASDVLRKVPLITVDLDGNVTMRGSDNVKVLVNGRPSGMFSANVADALKMMPADQIKSVEVITSPTARYDGEGTAGIINIITKKKNIEGVAGNIEGTAGTRQHRGNANLNYGKGRLGVNLSGGGHYSRPQTGATNFRREETLDFSQSLLTQDGEGVSSRLGFRTHGGIEYNPNAFNTINGSFSYRRYDSENSNDVESEYYVNNVFNESYRRIVNGNTIRSGWDAELDYKFEFPTKGQEWSIAVEVDNDDNESDFAYDQVFFQPIGLPRAIENNLNQSQNLETTIQTDYVHPFSEQIKMELGLKGTLRQLESDFSFSEFDSDLDQWEEDPARTDIFYYDQNVYAGYASFNFELGEKTSLITGARVELTDLKGRFEEFNNPFDNNYLSILPNATISQRFGEFNLIKLSYTQRIQRPNQRHINPFVEYNDNRDIAFGNPSLSPEKIQQLELGTTFFIKGSMINAFLFAKRTDDLIENLLSIDEDGLSTSTYYNFGKRDAVGLNLFGSLNIGKQLSVRGGIDVNAWKVAGDFEEESLSNSGYDYNGRLNLTWAITKSLKIEGFGFWRSPSFTVQGKNPSWSMLSVGLKQELFKRRMSIGLNFNEPFRENHIMERELEGNGFYQYSKSIRPIRSFGLTLGYRFGKLDFKERNGKQKVNNNDLKEDDHGDPPFQG